MQSGMEIISTTGQHGPIRSALFDFDGTISVIREGWQGVMIPYFAEELSSTPTTETPDQLYAAARDFVDLLTGKDTIFQCMRLAEEVEKRGGTPPPPLDYKAEYLRRLWQRIQDRIAGLKEGRIRPEEMVIEGSFRLLEEMQARGVQMYLASGTDQPDVLAEARLLGLERYFGQRVFGALDDWTIRSKATVIENILSTHRLAGSSLVTFGDGFVEIECTRAVGGLAIGVASDEVRRRGLNEWKRARLIQAGADVIIPDFLEIDAILEYLFSS